MSNYFIFDATKSPRYCKLGKPPEPLASQKWRIAEGKPIGEECPGRLRLDMDKKHEGVLVPDLVFNTLHIHVVTQKLKALLERHSGPSVEFVPVAIHDHKGRASNENCFIFNPLGTVDCVDRERSVFKESSLKPGEFSILQALQLHSERLPAEASFFRIKDMPSIIVIRDDLRADLEAAGVTGVQFIAMGEKCMFV